MILTQIGIAICGVTAIYLSQDTNPKRQRFACLFGLAGQPFWLWETISSQQWGIAALCVLYTWSWFRGFRAHWLKRGAR